MRSSIPSQLASRRGKLVLGKHSVLHAVKRAPDLSPEELDGVYQEITARADNKKGLMDEEIATLAGRCVSQTLTPAVERALTEQGVEET